jgi:two-component system response regulator CpxR
VLSSHEVSMDRRRCVLVVDDDQAIREVIAEVLRDEGYDVVCAENGVQALRELRRDHHPDVMLLDLMMPVMSGWELLEAVQADERLAKIPVLVVSAMTAPGVRACIPKPLDLDVLLRAVEENA